MAVDDRRVGFTSTTVTTKVAGGNEGIISKTVTVDCADDNVTSGDVVQLQYIPPGYYIFGVGADVETAEGDTLTVDVGLHLESNDAAVDADGFLDGFDGNATGVKLTSSEEYANDLVAVTAGTNLTATFNNAASAAKIHFTCHLLEIKRP